MIRRGDSLNSRVEGLFCIQKLVYKNIITRIQIYIFSICQDRE